jgi:ketosteroid isomerase-like protein
MIFPESMMMRRSLWVVAILSATVPKVAAQEPRAQDTTKAKGEIRALIEKYTQSIDAADTELGAQVWVTTPEASFIHPLGEESSWNEIATDVYGKLMGQMFSKRSLTLAAEPTIHVFGDAAVAEFHWDFVATLRSNGSAMHTMGRESQVYVKMPDKGWRLVHVHYSGPALPQPPSGNP